MVVNALAIIWEHDSYPHVAVFCFFFLARETPSDLSDPRIAAARVASRLPNPPAHLPSPSLECEQWSPSSSSSPIGRQRGGLFCGAPCVFCRKNLCLRLDSLGPALFGLAALALTFQRGPGRNLKGADGALMAACWPARGLCTGHSWRPKNGRQKRALCPTALPHPHPEVSARPRS